MTYYSPDNPAVLDCRDDIMRTWEREATNFPVDPITISGLEFEANWIANTVWEYVENGLAQEFSMAIQSAELHFDSLDMEFPRDMWNFAIDTWQNDLL